MSATAPTRLERIVCAVTFDVPAYLNARREQATSTFRAAYLAWTGSTLLSDVYVPQRRRPVAVDSPSLVVAEHNSGCAIEFGYNACTCSDYSGRRAAS